MGLFDYFDQEHVVSFDLAISPSCTRPTRILPPTSSSSRVVPLPLELVLLILQHANDKRTYLSSSLVCRAWSFPAQQFLFNHVSLSSQSACLAFLDSISQSPALASCVHTLSASIDHNQPFGLSQLSFAHAFSQCPNITDLRISLYGCAQPGKDIIGAPDMARMRRLAPSWDQQTLHLLSSSPSQVQKLSFSNWSENRTSLTQLLSVFDQLDQLVIVGTPPEVPRGDDNTPLPPSLSLSSLRVNFQTYPSPDYFAWLLHSSSINRSLRSITFDRVPPAPVLDFLFNDEGIKESLEAVYLPGLPSPASTTASAPAVVPVPIPTAVPKGTETILTTLSSLPRLKSLSIENPSSFLRVLLTNSLPPTLEHLAFGLQVDEPSSTPPSPSPFATTFASASNHARSQSLAHTSTSSSGHVNHARTSSVPAIKMMSNNNKGAVAGGPVGMRTLVSTVRGTALERLESVKVLVKDVDESGSSRVGRGESKWLASLKMVCAQRGVQLELERDVRRWREGVVGEW